MRLCEHPDCRQRLMANSPSVYCERHRLANLTWSRAAIHNLLALILWAMLTGTVMAGLIWLWLVHLH